MNSLVENAFTPILQVFDVKKLKFSYYCKNAY